MKCLIYEILTFEPQNEEINVKKIVAVKVGIKVGIVFRTDIFRKLTLGAPDDRHFCLIWKHSVV